MPDYGGFRVLELFHPTAMVTDLRAVSDLYRRVFGASSLTIPYTATSRAYRSLTVLADTCIENISPEQSTLSAFRMYTDIVGNHWYFPCFYVADMQDALYHLHHRHQIRLTESGTGNAVVGSPPGLAQGRSLLFTHPGDTGIMWEFWEGDAEWFATNPLADPRKRPGWKQPRPARGDALAADMLSHQTVVIRDPAPALRFLVEVCGGSVFAEEDDPRTGSRSTWVAVGDVLPTVFEIAVPTGEGPRARDLERVGNTVHSLTFRVRDLRSAVSHLKRNGLALEFQDERLAVTDPASSLGLRFAFAPALHPGDPRNTRVASTSGKGPSRRKPKGTAS